MRFVRTGVNSTAFNYLTTIELSIANWVDQNRASWNQVLLWLWRVNTIRHHGCLVATFLTLRADVTGDFARRHLPPFDVEAAAVSSRQTQVPAGEHDQTS